jgi:hypothetical protein
LPASILAKRIADLLGHLLAQALAQPGKTIKAEHHHADIDPMPGRMRQRLRCLQLQIFPGKQAAHRILDHLLATGFQVFPSAGQRQQVVQSGQYFRASSPLGDKIGNPELARLGPLLLGFLAGNQMNGNCCKRRSFEVRTRSSNS